MTTFKEVHIANANGYCIEVQETITTDNESRLVNVYHFTFIDAARAKAREIMELSPFDERGGIFEHNH
jgi:hypothetical protein